MTQPLAEYKRKRDFTKTAEPAGKAPQKRERALQFVVQKHAASHLHYDFRLELDGVMKSWAVPKGPNYDPSVKRLAMEVEDHPIEYNKFEGTIPKGQYGGGTVMLWDRGTYEAEDGGGADSLRDGYERGNLKFVLKGERLLGGWVLVRLKRPGARNQWLLIKHRDEYATSKVDVTEAVLTSVTTGRTMDGIAGGNSRVWNSDRVEKESTTDLDDSGPRSVSDVARTAKKKGAAKRSPARKKTTAKHAPAKKSAKRPTKRPAAKR
ncbi:MAG TPA: DNA polymerase ligase N-terminal domain-containing protein [Gemmatimonadaceae bacterium]